MVVDVPATTTQWPGRPEWCWPGRRTVETGRLLQWWRPQRRADAVCCSDLSWTFEGGMDFVRHPEWRGGTSDKEHVHETKDGLQAEPHGFSEGHDNRTSASRGREYVNKRIGKVIKKRTVGDPLPRRPHLPSLVKDTAMAAAVRGDETASEWPRGNNPKCCSETESTVWISNLSPASGNTHKP